MAKYTNNQRRKCKRSKASRARQARFYRRFDHGSRGNGGKKDEGKREVLIAHKDEPNLPTIAEYTTVMYAESLGSRGEPGMLAAAIVRYLDSLRESLSANQEVKRYARISFAFAYQGEADFTVAPQISGFGGVSLNIWDILLRPDVDGLAVGIEGGMRDIVTRINRQGKETVHLLAVVAVESDEPVEGDGSAFGIPEADSPMDAYFESEDWLRA